MDSRRARRDLKRFLEAIGFILAEFEPKPSHGRRGGVVPPFGGFFKMRRVALWIHYFDEFVMMLRVALLCVFWYSGRVALRCAACRGVSRRVAVCRCVSRRFLARKMLARCAARLGAAKAHKKKRPFWVSIVGRLAFHMALSMSFAA